MFNQAYTEPNSSELGDLEESVSVNEIEDSEANSDESDEAEESSDTQVLSEAEESSNSDYEDNDDSQNEDDEIFYDYYDDGNGLSFKIPDGWYAGWYKDNSFVYAYIYEDGVDGDALSIKIFRIDGVFDADENGNVDKDVIEKTFNEWVEYGWFDSYELTEAGEIAVGEYVGTCYDLKGYYTHDGEEIVTLTRYIVTEGDNFFCITLMSPGDGDSLAMVIDTFTKISDTLTLPSAEQLAYWNVEE